MSPAGGAERHAHPDFRRALRGESGDHAIEADGGQQQRQRQNAPSRLATIR